MCPAGSSSEKHMSGTHSDKERRKDFRQTTYGREWGRKDNGGNEDSREKGVVIIIYRTGHRG